MARVQQVIHRPQGPGRKQDIEKRRRPCRATSAAVTTRLPFARGRCAVSEASGPARVPVEPAHILRLLRLPLRPVMRIVPLLVVEIVIRGAGPRRWSRILLPSLMPLPPRTTTRAGASGPIVPAATARRVEQRLRICTRDAFKDLWIVIGASNVWVVLLCQTAVRFFHLLRGRARTEAEQCVCFARARSAWAVARRLAARSCTHCGRQAGRGRSWPAAANPRAHLPEAACQ